MEGRAGEGAILLLHDNDIDCAAESGRVDAVPGSRDTGAETANVVHGCVVVMRIGLVVNEGNAMFRESEVGSADG